MKDISDKAFQALTRGPMVTKLAEEMLAQEPGLADMGPIGVVLVADDAMNAAAKEGFKEFPSILWFGLTMVRVHPRFADQGSIALRLKASAGRPERERVTDVIENARPEDWEAAGQKGGFEDYYARVMARGVPHE